MLILEAFSEAQPACVAAQQAPALCIAPDAGWAPLCVSPGKLRLRPDSRTATQRQLVRLLSRAAEGDAAFAADGLTPRPLATAAAKQAANVLAAASEADEVGGGAGAAHGLATGSSGSAGGAAKPSLFALGSLFWSFGGLHLPV